MLGKVFGGKGPNKSNVSALGVDPSLFEDPKFEDDEVDLPTGYTSFYRLQYIYTYLQLLKDPLLTCTLLLMEEMLMIWK